MEIIVQLRQMMADEKFSDVQKLVEAQLSTPNEARHELLLIYFDVLKAQNRDLSPILKIELAEFECQKKNHHFVFSLINNVDIDSFYSRILKMKIQGAVDKGQMDDLYQLISEFLLKQFEFQRPVVPDWIETLMMKYFRFDYGLKLKTLAIALLQNDLLKSEALTRDIIVSCIERPSVKGSMQKLEDLAKILGTKKDKSQLEIYQNLCKFYTKGIGDKVNYKKVAEMIIYFDAFQMQAIVLCLMHRNGLEKEAKEFAAVIKNNNDYSYVYFDKFYPELKSYFFKIPTRAEEIKVSASAEDLKVNDEYRSELLSPSVKAEAYEDGYKFINILKFAEYSTDQLCDIAVGFLQSEMPEVALKASELAMKNSSNDKDYLKGSYLKLTSLLMLRDYRAAIDTCFDALTKSKSKDDILSFLYVQAEVFIRLNQLRDAKVILNKIVAIDEKYRMAKERLEKLDEI